MTPPKPKSRPDRVSLWRYFRLFRKDILSAQPERLYRAWMADFRTPFFRSFLVNQPDLVRTVLSGRPADFPKSDRVGEGLRPLLGRSVFLTNGEEWHRQRRIINPAFDRGRLREVFPALLAAGQASLERLPEGVVDIEETASHVAADAIFRTLFSTPIDTHTAAEMYRSLRAYQRTQPILNLAALVPLPDWFPRGHRRAARAGAHAIREQLRAVTQKRSEEIRAGTAPEDLATKIMTTTDPDSGESFDSDEMIDQVAIFFLAGHETSASALAWSLYLLAMHSEAQERVAQEAAAFSASPEFSRLSELSFTRDVFREALRLYPPVPMLVREAKQSEIFRDRRVPRGAQIVISPWHLHRHTRLWDRPDEFDPDRWKTDAGRACQREAYVPFSAGPRVCPGAGFAMVEGPLFLALLAGRYRFETVSGRNPVPVAYLTVRADEGIWLRVVRRTTARIQAA